MRKLIVTAVAATALAVPALGLGACGGEGEDGGSSDDQAATTTVTTTTEAAAPPEAEGPSLVSFIAAADAICREFNRNLDQFASADAAFHRASRAATDELAALETPPEVEIQYAQYIAALRDQDHFSRIGDAGEERAADRRKEAVAREIGFAECGTG